MSCKGNCYDNSVMENFFGIMKQEMYYGNTFYSFDELKETIEKYIKYYNEKRIKEKLGWMSPVQLSAKHRNSVAAVSTTLFTKSIFLGAGQNVSATRVFL